MICLIYKIEKYHGVGGPLPVEKKKWGTPLEKHFIEAGQELGYDHIDANAAKQIG